MKIKSIIFWSLLTVSAGFYTSCKKDAIGIRNVGSFTDTTAILKSSTSIPIGMAIDANAFANNATYKAKVIAEANSATLIDKLNNATIMQTNGSLDFTNADAAVNAVTTAGLNLYGYNLISYKNQSATYLKLHAKITLPPSPELITNPGFESSTTALTNWNIFNSGNPSGTSTISLNTTTANAHAGSNSMMVVNPVGYPGSQWRVQVASDLFNTTVGATYNVSYWVKAASAGGSIRLSTAPTASYQGDQTIGTSWAQISWSFTAQDAQSRIVFDMGQAVNTYYVDDVSIKQVQVVATGPVVADTLNKVMNRYITQTVNHYKDKIHTWSVVSEPLADNGSIRTTANTTSSASDVMIWSNYIGKDFALNALNYAKAADATAQLFIDESFLDFYPAKVDSLIVYINYLKAKGATVDGVGVLFQVSINANPYTGNQTSSYANIDNALRKLGATGMKIRISGISVNANPLGKPVADFNLGKTLFLDQQAEIYKYIMESYVRNIPITQRHGITFWGVNDGTNSIVIAPASASPAAITTFTSPLLLDENFVKKPAYSAVLQALKGQ